MKTQVHEQAHSHAVGICTGVLKEQALSITGRWFPVEDLNTNIGSAKLKGQWGSL